MDKGLLVHVFRTAAIGDCSNCGISSRYDKFILTGDGVTPLFYPSPDAPELRLSVEKIQVGGPDDFLTRVCAYPVNKTTSETIKNGASFGGNFVYSCDSRFPHLGAGGWVAPIPIHDRYEDAETVRLLWEMYPSSGA